MTVSPTARFQAEQKARSKLHARRSDARKSSTWRKMAQDSPGGQGLSIAADNQRPFSC